MNGLVFHIVSGQAFFTGAGLMIVAATASTRSTAVFKRVTVLAFLAGLISVVVSSTAIPYWYYGWILVVTVGWIVSYYIRKRHQFEVGLFIGTWIVGTAIEIPYHLMPKISPVSSRAMTIIGDSVTAGIGGDERSETWPKIMAREHDLNVQDISHMGDTAASALKRVKIQGVHSPLVVIEIGGNDLLGSTTSAQFAADLDALLTTLERPDRQIVMFELPLPPFCHEYGRIQRESSHRHRVRLIPKRVFLSVVAIGESTLDSVHLSQSGHQQMANGVWEIVQPAFASTR